jgi:serine/threonine protein kinase
VSVEAERQAREDASLPKMCPSCGTRFAADALFCPFDGAPLVTSPAAIAKAAATDPYIGHEITGPIEIRQLVGIGAMGRVYRGFQKGIDRDVAVKILHRELSANPAVVARFHREAKVASRLAHPHVVHVLLTGQLPDGAMYMVMEYLDGMSLQSALAATGGAMALPRALHIALGLCDAVGEAHAQGIVHRDLKPENVMLVRRADDPDFVKVLDFGIARLNWGDQSMATAQGLIFGTARYISPEAAQGEKVGPPGDVYSIATMFYQMLSGKTPFDAEQAVALLVHQIHDPPPPLKSIPRAVSVPEPIAAVVMSNLAKRPEKRSENARDLGRALLEAAVASGMSAHDILAWAGMGGGSVRASDASVPVARTVFDAPVSDSHGARAVLRTEIAEPSAEADGRRVVPSPSAVDATMNEQQQPSTPSVPSTSYRTLERSERADAAKAYRTLERSERADDNKTSRPSSSVDTRPGVTQAAPPTARGRTTLVVVLCFLVGAIAMASIASPEMFGGKRVIAPQRDTLVARANSALLHQQWDSPKDDNVRDITDDGLSRWPHDPQLLRIRALACGDIVKAAHAKRDEGNVTEALRLAKLAYELDPSDNLTQKLVGELESQAQAPPLDSVPPLSGAPTSGGNVAAVGGLRVTLDASNPKPAIGQAVDFAARVVGAGAHAKVDGAGFRVSGPGIPPATQLEAGDDGSGVFRTTFTFLQAGRFELSFAGRIDGGPPLRAVRIVQVGQAVSEGTPRAPPPPPSTEVSSPEPASSAKWL